jgi:putative ABC transport system permease protein
MYSRIAIRNLLKNKTRTLLSIMMISGAMVAMIVFRGYVLKTLDIVQTVIVNGQYGHLQIGKKSYWDQTAVNRQNALIFNPKDLENTIEANPLVDFASQRLTFFGLVSTENSSESGYFIGIDVVKEKHFNQGIHILEGEILNPQNRGSVIIGNLLAKRMKVKPGDEITIVTNTLDKVINAIDVKVAGIFTTGTEEFDRLSCFIHLEDAQKILQTTAAEHLRVSLKSIETLPGLRDAFNSQLDAQGLKVKSWYELSDLFRKVEIFYNTQTGIMYFILMFIVGLGMMNTFSMSLTERIGEIGTLRALGQSRSSLFAQFMMESFYLCMIGLVIGVAFSYLLITGINAANIYTEIPGASIPVRIEIGFYTEVVIGVCLIIIFVVNAFTVFLINRFIRMNIVEALRRNI